MEHAKFFSSTSETCADKAFIESHLTSYLSYKGYNVAIEKSQNKDEVGHRLLAISQRGRKEIIEVKGYWDTTGTSTVSEGVTYCYKKEVKSWLSHLLFDSIVSFGEYIIGSKCSLSVALPDTSRSRHLIEKLQPYFTDNLIDLKVYLVNESGKVEERNLNTLKKERTSFFCDFGLLNYL